MLLILMMVARGIVIRWYGSAAFRASCSLHGLEVRRRELVQGAVVLPLPLPAREGDDELHVRMLQAGQTLARTTFPARLLPAAFTVMTRASSMAMASFPTPAVPWNR